MKLEFASSEGISGQSNEDSANAATSGIGCGSQRLIKDLTIAQ